MTQVEFTQADINRAETVCQSTFIRTQHSCLLKVERARELIKQSTALKSLSGVEINLEKLFDGLSIMICEVLLDTRHIDDAAQAFARHRIEPEQAAAATITELRAENARLMAERTLIFRNPRVNDALQTAMERGELTLSLQGYLDEARATYIEENS